MDCRGFKRTTQVLFVLHIHDCVMNEDRVESAAEAYGLHVAFNVLTFRIERSTQLDHSSREIDQGHLEMRFEVARVVSATRPEFKHRGGRRRTGIHYETSREFGF